MPEERLAKTWDVSAFDRVNNEWTTTQNHSYENAAIPEDFVALQAVAARITPSRRKPVESDHDDIFVFSDMQVGYRRVLDYATREEELVPLHDERKVATALAIAKYLRPALIVNLSDTLDAGEISRFAPDSDQFFRTLTPSIQRIHDFYAQMRSDNPQARIVEVASNHNERLNKTVMKQLPAFYGLQRPGDSQYPVLSYPYLTNLEHVGVEWIGGYPAGTLMYKTHGGDTIRFAHGTETSSGMSTAAAKAMRNNGDVVNIQGHDHKHSEAWKTTREGRYIGSIVIGALCKTTGEVPGWHTSVGDDGKVVPYQENWQSSVLHIRDHKDGNIEYNRIFINADGSAAYNGKRF